MSAAHHLIKTKNGESIQCNTGCKILTAETSPSAAIDQSTSIMLSLFREEEISGTPPTTNLYATLAILPKQSATSWNWKTKRGHITDAERYGTVYHTGKNWIAVFRPPWLRDDDARIVVHQSEDRNECEFALSVVRVECCALMLINDLGYESARRLVERLDLYEVMGEEVRRGRSR